MSTVPEEQISKEEAEKRLEKIQSEEISCWWT
jgi:hypothetical protein